MFDFRYHVASLAAVFIALVVGMLVGAGISGRGLLDETERARLNARIAQLEDDVRHERRHASELIAAAELADAAHVALLEGRLREKRVAVVFLGSVDGSIRGAVEQTVALAGGRIIRLGALRMPIASTSVEAELRRRPALHGYLDPLRTEDLGRDLGREFVEGGDMPLLRALDDPLVEEQGPLASDPADAVVVCRTARPQDGQTASFLNGVYAGVAGAGVPAVGVETSTVSRSAIEVYRRSGLSSVDDVDLQVGRVALAVLLAGGPAGHYGVKPTASAAVPPIDPVPPADE
ncbi:MAG: copper transporter [Thermoleophilia bacterium]|nr:copper transporter [Thermoleophilia bacterium]